MAKLYDQYQDHASMRPRRSSEQTAEFSHRPISHRPRRRRFCRRRRQPSMEDTYSATEVAAMMGVHRNTVYGLIEKGLFKTERYNDRPRIDKESFEAWYRSQTHYYIPAFEKEA